MMLKIVKSISFPKKSEASGKKSGRPLTKQYLQKQKEEPHGSPKNRTIAFTCSQVRTS